MTEKELGTAEIERVENFSWRRALTGASGSATTTFVVMEASALIAQYISGEVPQPDRIVVDLASGVGAFLLGLRGFSIGGLLTEHDRTPFPIKFIRSVEMGALNVGLAIGFLAGFDKLTNENIMHSIATPLIISWFASKGIMEGWNNMAGGRGIGFRVFKGRSIIPFRSN